MRKNATTLGALAVAVALAACGTGGDSGSLSGTGASNDPGASASGANNAGPGGSTPGTGSTFANNSGADPNAQQNPNMNQRVTNYGEALRTATLKLVGALPTLKDIHDIAAVVTAADGGKSVYEAKIDLLLADPRFAERQVTWWKDTFKTGGQSMAKQGQDPDTYNYAAYFAASVVVNGRPFTDLFTATTGTCPKFTNGTFTPANCSGSQPTAGVLTDPGLMSQYYANMAFRRVRFVQETFVCNKFPTEFSGLPEPLGAGLYTSPWDFKSIAGGTGARMNFQDTSSVVCANCHTTMNHLAPLFAHFDADGVYDATKFQVMTPSTGTPTSQLSDWLSSGQTFAWRNGKTVADLPSLGKEIAADPDVARCAVNRVWNYAMSRGDIVNDLATLPPVVTDPLVADFTANNMNLKRVIRNVFTADDFVKF